MTHVFLSNRGIELARLPDFFNNNNNFCIALFSDVHKFTVGTELNSSLLSW